MGTDLCCPVPSGRVRGSPEQIAHFLLWLPKEHAILGTSELAGHSPLRLLNSEGPDDSTASFLAPVILSLS